MSYILPYFKVVNDVTLNYEGSYALDGRKTEEATSVKLMVVVHQHQFQ